MALTTAQEARYQQLGRQLGIISDPVPQVVEPDGMLGFAGKTLGNLPGSAAEKMVQGWQGLFNMITPEGGELPLTQVPRLFDRSEPQGIGQHIIGGAGELASYLPAMLSAESIAASALRGVGLGATAARVGGAAAGFGLPMAPHGGDSVVAQGLAGGTMSLAQGMGARGKIAMGLIGAGAGYYEGQKHSPEMGGIMAGLNFISPTIIDPLIARALKAKPVAGRVVDPPAQPGTSGTPAQPGTPGTIPGFDPNAPVPPQGIAPMQLGGTYPLQPAPNGIPFFQVPPPLDIGGGRPIAGQPFVPAPGIPGPPMTSRTRFRRTDYPPEVPAPETPIDLLPVLGTLGKAETALGDGLLTRAVNDPMEGRLMQLPEATNEPRFGGLMDIGSTPQMRGPVARGSERKGFIDTTPVPAAAAPAAAEVASLQILSAAGEPVNLAPRQEGPHVISTLIKDNDSGTLHAGSNWRDAHASVKSQDPTKLLATKFDLPSEAGEAEHMFLIRDENGAVRPANREEAGKIADLAKQRDADFAGYPLQSEHLIEPPAAPAAAAPLKAHPQSKLPSGLQKLLADDPAWTAAGQGLGQGFTRDAFKFGASLKTAADVKRAYAGAAKLEKAGLAMLESGDMDLAMELIYKAQYLREAAEYAEGLPGKLSHYREIDPNYKPAVPGKTYLAEQAAAKKKVEVAAPVASLQPAASPAPPARPEYRLGEYSTHGESGQKPTTSKASNEVRDEVHTAMSKWHKAEGPDKHQAALELNALFPKAVTQAIRDMTSANAARVAAGMPRLWYFSPHDIGQYLEHAVGYTFPFIEKKVKAVALKKMLGRDVSDWTARPGDKDGRITAALHRAAKAPDSAITTVTTMSKAGREVTGYMLKEAEETVINRWARDIGHKVHTDYNGFWTHHEIKPEVASLQPAAPAPVAHADKVRIKGRFGMEDATIIGREGDTLHVEIDDPIFGKRQTSVLASDVLPVMEQPHAPTGAGERPFQDVKSLELTGREGVRGTAHSGGIEGKDQIIGMADDQPPLSKWAARELKDREALVKALEALPQEKANQTIVGIDGPYNPHVLQLTKNYGLRKADGKVRSVAEEIAFQKSEIAKTLGDRPLGAMLEGPGPAKGGKIPGVYSIVEALSALPREAGDLINSVIHRLQQAAGQAMDIHFSYNMPGAKAGAYGASGRIGFNNIWVTNLVKNWAKMSETSQTKAIMQILATTGHEITHVAQKYGEQSGLAYKGKPLLAALQEQVEALNPAQRLHIIKEIQALKGASLNERVALYLSGDIKTIYDHYRKSRPGLTMDGARELAAGEFMAEMGSIELAKRMNTTGLPAPLRAMIDSFKQAVVRAVAWLRGNTGNVAAMQDLQAISARMYDHFAAADKAALDRAFPASHGWQGKAPTATPPSLLSGHGPALPQMPPSPRAVPPPPTPSVPPTITVEKQFLVAELARLGVRTAVGGAIGAVAGPRMDSQISTAEGVLLGGVLGAFGPTVARKLLQKDLALEVKEAFKLSKGKPMEALVRIFGGGRSLEEMGRDARFGWTGQASTMAKFVRFLESEFDLNLDPKLRAALEEARGNGTLVLATVQDALDKARWFKPGPGLVEMVEHYFTGKIDRAAFEAALTSPEMKAYGNFIVTAREGLTTLSRMFAEGMPKGKFQQHLIASSEKYLGRFYSAYKEGKFNMDAFDRAKQDYMRVAGVDALNADDHLREHMREVLANRTVFGGRRGNSGQKIDSSLTFRKLATEQEIEAQQVVVAGLEHNKLGVDYIAEKAKLDWMETHKITDNWRDWLGEVKDPIERMVYSFQKVHASAISAKAFDLLDNRVNSDGLRFSYTEKGLTQAREFFEHGKTVATTPEEVASLQLRLDKLSGYGQLPEGSAYGKLAMKYVDRHTRDAVNTYATPYKWMEQPILRGIAEFNNVVKMGRTAFNPLTVVRNYLQMPAMGLIAKTTAGDVGEAYRIIHHLKNDDYKLMLQQHIIGADFVSSELGKGPGYLFSGRADADIAQRVSKYGIDKILEFYQQPDMLIRAGAFISARRRFANEFMESAAKAGAPVTHNFARVQSEVIEKATAFTQRYTMNYATVPRIVKIGRQLPFINLFISYTSEITRILKNLVEDAVSPTADSAGRMHAITTLAAMAAIPAGLTAAFENSLSKKDQADWKQVRALQPDYARARFMIPTRRDKDGRFHYFDLTNLLPADNYSQMIKAFASGDAKAALTANPIASLQNTPMLNIAAEQIAGQDLRTGRKMVGPMGRINEVLKEILPPVLPPGYEGERLIRAFSENKDGGMGTTNLRTGVQTLPSDIVKNYLTGMRFGNVQLATVQRQAISEAKQAIADQQRLMRDTTGTDAGPEKVREAQNRYTETVKQIMLQLHTRLDITSP